MADEQDWSLQDQEDGTVVIRMGETNFFNLGPRDEALTRFADHFGDEAVIEQPEGYDVHADPGDFGETAG